MPPKIHKWWKLKEDPKEEKGRFYENTTSKTQDKLTCRIEEIRSGIIQSHTNSDI